MLSKFSYLNSNIALTLGYLNPALNNSALLFSLLFKIRQLFPCGWGWVGVWGGKRNLYFYYYYYFLFQSNLRQLFPCGWGWVGVWGGKGNLYFITIIIFFFNQISLKRKTVNPYFLLKGSAAKFKSKKSCWTVTDLFLPFQYNLPLKPDYIQFIVVLGLWIIKRSLKTSIYTRRKINKGKFDCRF